MKIKRPEPKVKIPESAQHSKSVITDSYTWKDKNGETVKRNKRPDLIQIIPINAHKKALLVELRLPNESKEYRILEQDISDTSDVQNEIKNLLDRAGLDYTNIKLLTKGQPFDIGEYPLDCAVYVFVADSASIKNNPTLDYQVPYKFIEKEISKLVEETKDGKIINSALLTQLEDLEIQLS